MKRVSKWVLFWVALRFGYRQFVVGYKQLKSNNINVGDTLQIDTTYSINFNTKGQTK